MENARTISSTPSVKPTRLKLKPLSAEDLEIARQNGHRLIEAARQGDEALQAEVARLYPRGPR